MTLWRVRKGFTKDIKGLNQKLGEKEAIPLYMGDVPCRKKSMCEGNFAFMFVKSSYF